MSYPEKKIGYIRPVHVHLKTDKLDYLRSPSYQKKQFCSLASRKLLAALGSGILTCSLFKSALSLHGYSLLPFEAYNFPTGQMQHVLDTDLFPKKAF